MRLRILVAAAFALAALMATAAALAHSLSPGAWGRAVTTEAARDTRSKLTSSALLPTEHPRPDARLGMKEEE